MITIIIMLILYLHVNFLWHFFVNFFPLNLIFIFDTVFLFDIILYLSPCILLCFVISRDRYSVLQYTFLFFSLIAVYFWILSFYFFIIQAICQFINICFLKPFRVIFYYKQIYFNNKIPKSFI